MNHATFCYQSKEELLADFRSKQIPLGFCEETAPLGMPLSVNGVQIKNRILSQPIEGFDAEPDGSPSNRSIKRYCTLSENAIGTIWFESISVCKDGRSNPYQLWITKDNCNNFKQMLQQVRAASPDAPPYLVAQLTHSGRYSKPTPLCGFENPLIKKDASIIVSDAYLQRLEDQYVEAALLAEQAGFDAVDIRACHGYLINELFSAYSRSGKYGGCYENRVRLLCNIIRKLHAKSNITIGVRLNLFDGLPYPYGWGVPTDGTVVPNVQEPMRLLEDLTHLGVSILNVSSGIGAVSPHVIRPYDRGGPLPPEHPLEGIYRMLDMAHQVKASHPNMIVVASAFSWLREFAPAVATSGITNGWYDLAGFGRQCICYPRFARDILSGVGMDRRKCCTTCCGCTTLIKKSEKKLRCIHHPETE